jgi:hypothetical protein
MGTRSVWLFINTVRPNCKQETKTDDTTAENQGVTIKSFLQRHSLIIGLALMFLYTWTIDLSNSASCRSKFRSRWP